MATRKYTGYMKKVTSSLQTMGPAQRILDIPAGYGQFADELRRLGHEVVLADVVKYRPEYVHANMNFPLPFPSDEFDVVTCLEGIEHVINPVSLLAELIRVTRPTGRVYLSTPNIMNYYSRLQYLLTGTYYGFSPAEVPDPSLPRSDGNVWHISPISYTQIRYFANYFGADVHDLLGDRYKRKILFPIYAALYLLGRPWSWLLFNTTMAKKLRRRNREIYRHINSAPLLLSRSTIIVLKKHGKAA